MRLTVLRKSLLPLLAVALWALGPLPAHAQVDVDAGSPAVVPPSSPA
ncbi:hypothetical protein HNS30_24545, partial [Corallococcus exercitus]|nr:hypothetical protein [Corallococcus exercitus]